MAQAFRYFIKGIELRGETVDPSDNVEGSVFHNSSSQRLKTYIQGSIREIVTSSQQQTLSNKTIDADNNTISNLEVDNLKAGVLNTSAALSGASDTQIPSALAVKTYIDDKAAAQNEASEISFAPVGTISATTVQAMGQELDSDIQGHINDTTAAHAASSISNTPSGNLAATDVQSALNELQTDIDSKASGSTVSSHISATSGVHGVTGSIVGTSDSQSLTNKTIDADLNTITNIENADIKANAAIDASKIANGSVSNTEFQYLDGVTSPIQTQIGGKQDTITGAATSIVSADLTASRAVVSDASGKVAASSVTSTELGHLSGVTSAIQTQLNGKEPTITTLPISKGGTNSSTALNNNRVMQSSGGAIVEAAAITASRALISDANGIPTHSSVTSATLAFLDATSSVQTQLNAKVNASGGTLTNGSIVTPVRSDVKQDTLANLTTYALTATNGQIVYATDEKAMYQVVDGELVGIGGAGVVKLTAGENISIRDLVYISTGTGNDSGRTAGRIYKVDASNDDRVEVLGFATKAITSGSIGEVQVSGNLKGFTGLTAGKIYYASAATPGAITLTPPSTNGQWVVSVALASSSSEIIINPVSSASAIYVTDSDTSFTIANNQSSVANVTGLLFDGVATRSFILDYSIYRQTSTASSAVAQVGQLRGVFNTQSGTWLMTDDFSGQNAGVNFSITIGGQIQYTSTNIAGASYVGSLKYAVRKTFGV